MNETQNSFRVLVPGRLVTHCHSPFCHCQLGLTLQRGGTGGWTLGTRGCSFHLKWCYTGSQLPMSFGGIGNWTYNQALGFPMAGGRWVKGQNDEGKLLGMPHTRACTQCHCPLLLHLGPGK